MAGTLPTVTGLGGRHRYYTHINNTNPLLDAQSEAAHAVCEAGWAIAEDGFSFSLSKESGDDAGPRK